MLAWENKGGPVKEIEYQLSKKLRGKAKWTHFYDFILELSL
jgi:hypothetical protein